MVAAVIAAAVAVGVRISAEGNEMQQSTRVVSADQ